MASFIRSWAISAMFMVGGVGAQGAAPHCRPDAAREPLVNGDGDGDGDGDANGDGDGDGDGDIGSKCLRCAGVALAGAPASTFKNSGDN